MRVMLGEPQGTPERRATAYHWAGHGVVARMLHLDGDGDLDLDLDGDEGRCPVFARSGALATTVGGGADGVVDLDAVAIVAGIEGEWQGFRCRPDPDRDYADKVLAEEVVRDVGADPGDFERRLRGAWWHVHGLLEHPFARNSVRVLAELLLAEGALGHPQVADVIDTTLAGPIDPEDHRGLSSGQAFCRRYRWGAGGSSTVHPDNPGNPVLTESGFLFGYDRGWPQFRTLDPTDPQVELRFPVVTRCRRCGVMIPPEDHDPCIAGVDGAGSACCGHGVQRGYVVFGNHRSGGRGFSLCVNCRWRPALFAEARCAECHAWVKSHDDERPADLLRADLADAEDCCPREGRECLAVAEALRRAVRRHPDADLVGAPVLLRLPPLSWA